MIYCKKFDITDTSFNAYVEEFYERHTAGFDRYRWVAREYVIERYLVIIIDIAGLSKA